jgi:hypothetical protein
VPDDLGNRRALLDIRFKIPEFTATHEAEAVNQMLRPFVIGTEPWKLQGYPEAGVVASIQSHLSGAAKRIALNISAREPEPLGHY